MASQFDPQIFDGFEFLGLVGGFEYKSVNEAAFPTRGIHFSSTLGWKTILNDADRSFAYFNADLAFYQKLEPKGNLALAIKFGLQHRFNEEFPFYQGARLGGTGPVSNFRGYRRERFIGQTAFVQNTDIRWRGFKIFNNVFPTSVGLLGGFDYGRVWLDSDDSDQWHYSYGGGLWLSPFDVFTLNFSVFQTDEEISRFTFGGQFFF